MAYTSSIKSYTIDLTQKEKHRWKHVISLEKSVAKKLIENSKEEYEDYIELSEKLFEFLYKVYGGLYIDEMESWAKSMRIPLGEVIMLNCQYELNHILNYMEPFREKVADFWNNLKTGFGILGCTGAIVYNRIKGLVHIRNMDWEIKGLGGATRIFRFTQGKREFITVGVPGQIGVLSGMLPQAYSVTMNYASVGKMTFFNGYGPMFLLRQVFEECDTFEEAVKELKDNNLATNCFFLLSGIKKDEACAIERTKDKSSVRYIDGNYKHSEIISRLKSSEI